MLEAKISVVLIDQLPVLSVSDSINELLGFTAGDFLTARISLKNLIHPHDQDISETLFASDSPAESGGFNIRIRQANGRICCIKGFYEKRAGADGSGVILELLLQDAKSLKRTLDEAVLMPSFRAMMENTDDYIYFKDRNHVFTGASQTLVSLCSPAECWTDLIGQTDYDVFPEGYADIYYHLEKQVFAGIAIAHEIQETMTNDGRKGWVDNRKYPIRDTNGAIIGLYGIARDVSVLKRSEVALLQNEKRLNEAQRIAKMGHWELDQTNNKLIWSDEIYRIFEIDPKKFGASYESFLETIHPDDREYVNSAYAGSLINKNRYSIEHRLLMKDNRVKYVFEQCETFFDSDGQPLRSIGTVQNITERRLAEEERCKLESQLRQAQKLESIGSLAGGVAHDFNNKLSIILGCTYLASAESDPDKLQNYLDQIRTAAEQSADLTRQLLTFARKQTIAPKVLDLNETLSGIHKMLSRLMGENITLAWQPVADLWPLKIDPSQIDQILANLCVNARDAITDDGKITIETGNCIIDENYCSQHAEVLPGEYVRLVVSDNGCGMDDETRTRIFEPFFTTKEVGKGTGLGLATVFGIVKQNNGFINVYSEPGLGTTFTIGLPRHIGLSKPAQSEGQEIPVPRGLETVLLVEDELTILDIAATILTKQGYTALQANTPTEAIRLAKEHVGEISLVITDVVMPEMNGKELAQKLQSLHPQLKCIFMSGYTVDAISQHGVLDEGVNFIQKPFSLPDLATKVREVLDRK